MGGLDLLAGLWHNQPPAPHSQPAAEDPPRKGKPVQSAFKRSAGMISKQRLSPPYQIELRWPGLRVVRILHVKPGQGLGLRAHKLKGVQSAALSDKTFRAGETCPACSEIELS